LEIRKTGIGWKGQLVRFYKQRKKAKPKPEHKEVRAILQKMGLSVTISQVRKASRRLGLSIASEESINGETIRKLFKHFYGDCQKGA
jgi:transposase